MNVDIPFINALGVEFISAQHGTSVLALDLLAWHLNSWAVPHGGVLMSLLDVGMATAARSAVAGSGGGITVDMSTSFLQPARDSSRLVATSRALHHTGNTVFCEGEVRDGEHRLIAKAIGTFKIRPPAQAPERSG